MQMDIKHYMHCGKRVLFARIVDYGGHLRPRHYFDEAIENLLNNVNSLPSASPSMTCRSNSHPDPLAASLLLQPLPACRSPTGAPQMSHLQHILPSFSKHVLPSIFHTSPNRSQRLTSTNCTAHTHTYELALAISVFLHMTSSGSKSASES